MKKTIKPLFVFAAAALSFIGCQKVENEPSFQSEGQYKYSFTIVEDATKAEIGDNSIEWVAGDQVGMFVGSYKGYAKVDVTTTPKKVVLYSPNAIPAGTIAYAYAPYDPENKNNEPSQTKILVNNIQSGAGVSAMPLAGLPFEVEEEVAAGNQDGNGQIKFLNLGSLINFKVFSTNEYYQDETIQYIQFESSKAIAGIGHLDLTAVDMNDESSFALEMDTEENIVKVVEEMPVVADKEEAGPIKMVILPGTFEGTLTVVTDVATYTKAIPERDFARSHSRTFGLDLAKAERTEGVVEVVKTLPYEEAFTANQGDFKIENVTLPEGDPNLWSFDASYGAKVTAYINKTNYASETWLVSPQIDLTDVDAAELSFDQCVNKYLAAGDATLWIKKVGDENYTQISNTYPVTASNGWSSFEAKTVSLSDYVGNKIVFAFKYISSTESAGTWEIKNFKVEEIVFETEFSIALETLTVQVGQTKSNVVTVNSGATISYVSDDETIATVDEEGNVTGVAEGETYVYVSVPAYDGYPAAEDMYAVTVVPAVEEKNFTWDFSVASYATASASAVVWSNDNVTMENAKGTGTDANNYIPPTRSSTRFYSGNELTITPKGTCEITKIEFTAASTNYATVLKGSTWTNATAEVKDDVVTVTPLDGASAIIAAVGGTCGITEVKVYYTGGVDVVVTEYTITINNATNGKVTASAETATQGTEITLTVTPNEDYQLETLTVVDANNNPVAVNNFKFSMPASNVTVSATFKEKESGSYVLNPVAGSNNGYAGNCDITIDGITWNVTGNATLVPWRLGGKGLDGVDRSVYSKTALGFNVEKIVITNGATTITVNSIKVEVASDADFSNVISTLTADFEANATVTFARPTGVNWSNCFYRITYNVTNTTNSNKYVEFALAEFSGE